MITCEFDAREQSIQTGQYSIGDTFSPQVVCGRDNELSIILHIDHMGEWPKKMR